MQTPSASVVTAAQVAPDVTDRDGRRLELRRLTALDKLRLYKAAGPVLTQNAAWMGVAVLAASVAAIDGVPVPAPASEAQIEVLVGRLGETGLAAVSTGLGHHEATSAEVAAAAGN